MKRACALILSVAALAGCGAGQRNPLGDVRRGNALIRQYSCGACHDVPGVQGADGTLAPSLQDYSRRAFVAGLIPNTPSNLARWILDPPSIEPGTAMPRLGLAPDQARDIAAYLLTST